MPGLSIRQRRLGQRAQRRGQGETGLLPALQLGSHREEVRGRLVLVGAAVQGGAQGAADAVTAAACSSRTITSRTGRSPMLVTMPLTVTTGSLVVVTTSGVT